MDEKLREQDHARGLVALKQQALELRKLLERFHHEMYNPSLLWPNMLDQFHVVLAKVSALFDRVKDCKFAPDELVIAPVSVSTELDEALARATQVPVLLRTKLLPKMEAREKEMMDAAEKADDELYIDDVIEAVDKALAKLQQQLDERHKQWHSVQTEQRVWFPTGQPILNERQEADFKALNSALLSGAGLRR